MPGVGGANISGAATRQIQIQLDPDAMRAYNISPPVVIAALERENREVPAGRVRRNGREQLIRVTGRVTRSDARFTDIGAGGAQRHTDPRPRRRHGRRRLAPTGVQRRLSDSAGQHPAVAHRSAEDHRHQHRRCRRSECNADGGGAARSTLPADIKLSVDPR
ncbi:MAG: efflux RND transporter permease subunit [Gemmatimonadaceae bacterium]|nr:efflux RND transporter permease subunit [Gemmatimonadaceae bacterium]